MMGRKRAESVTEIVQQDRPRDEAPSTPKAKPAPLNEKDLPPIPSPSAPGAQTPNPLSSPTTSLPDEGMVSPSLPPPSPADTFHLLLLGGSTFDMATDDEDDEKNGAKNQNKKRRPSPSTVEATSSAQPQDPASSDRKTTNPSPIAPPPPKIQTAMRRNMIQRPPRPISKDFNSSHPSATGSSHPKITVPAPPRASTLSSSFAPFSITTNLPSTFLVSPSLQPNNTGKHPRRQVPQGRPQTAGSTNTVSSSRTLSETFTDKEFEAEGWGANKKGRNRIKFGTGRYKDVELCPQPSDEVADPLNWAPWKKDLHLFSLLLLSALVGAAKTAYVTINTDISIAYGVSYTAAVSLTAVPLMVAAVSGFGAQVLGRMLGKRPVYLVSGALFMVGAVWNVFVHSGDGGQEEGMFVQNVVARVVQGLGWGAFDTLVLGSIKDVYFEHERQSRIAIYTMVTVAATWGSPLLGGLVAEMDIGFVVQFRIIASVVGASMLLLLLAVPETAFDRVNLTRNSSASGSGSAWWMNNGDHTMLQPSNEKWPHPSFRREAVVGYLKVMRPWSYRASGALSETVMQVPRAMMAPTTILLFCSTLLPYVALWSIASSLSMLFSALPFMLSSTQMGLLLTGPFLLGTLVAALTSYLPMYSREFTPTVHVATLAGTALFTSLGVIGFGIYMEQSMAMPGAESMGRESLLYTQWSLKFVGDRLSFPVVSLLLGSLAAGWVATDATIRPSILRSTNFTSANITASLRNTADMHGGLICLRNFFAGCFILGLPNAAWSWHGLEVAAIIMGSVQVAITLAICTMWWFWDGIVRRLDGEVMGLVNMQALMRQGSFFDD